MTVLVRPSKAIGEISAPPSKSIAHRALICAALSGGSYVRGLDFSDDIKATANALKALGAGLEFSGDTVFAGGLNPEYAREAVMDCNESGSTLRFLIPVCMLSGKKIMLQGAKRLFERDLSVYGEIARSQGIGFSASGDCLTVCGKLKAGVFKVRGDISSQFISGLLFALPLLDGDSVIELKTPIESKPYIDITISVLSRFGIDVQPQNNGYFIKGNQKYTAADITVEGDYSNAAALDVYNLFGGNVKVNGLKSETAQGDRAYKDIFKALASGGCYDLSDCPDLAPLLFSASSHFSGARFTGTSRLRIKESDRARSMAEELQKFGARVLVYDNEVVVEKSRLHSPTAPLCSHNDHRIVMALCPLLSVYGGEIKGAEAVNKSYPAFFDDIKKLGIEVEFNDD